MLITYLMNLSRKKFLNDLGNNVFAAILIVLV